MRNLVGIKPQDVLIMMKLAVKPGLSQKELSDQLLISQAEVSHGLKRLKASYLMSDRKIMAANAAEFLIHAVKYLYPAQFNMPSAGMPTAFAHPDFKYVNYDPSEIYVWPIASGRKRGTSLHPIYPTLPEACEKDKDLYRLASWVEMIRAGRVREKVAARDEINKFFKVEK